MLRIGLTGGIGSGKSTVATIFRVLGIPVYYADDETRRMMNEDGQIKAAIKEHFGKQSYKEEKLDRAYIASIVFSDEKELEWLNALTHPATIRRAAAWMEQLTQPGALQPPYAIKEAA